MLSFPMAARLMSTATLALLIIKNCAGIETDHRTCYKITRWKPAHLRMAIHALSVAGSVVDVFFCRITPPNLDFCQTGI